MWNEDLEILSSLLRSVDTNGYVENILRAMHLKKMSKFNVIIVKSANISGSTSLKKINEGLIETSILCL